MSRQLLEEIKGNSSNSVYNNNNNNSNNNNNVIKINIIATDGNYSYDKVIINKGYNIDYNKYK